MATRSSVEDVIDAQTRNLEERARIEREKHLADQQPPRKYDAVEATHVIVIEFDDHMTRTHECAQPSHLLNGFLVLHETDGETVRVVTYLVSKLLAWSETPVSSEDEEPEPEPVEEEPTEPVQG